MIESYKMHIQNQWAAYRMATFCHGGFCQKDSCPHEHRYGLILTLGFGMVALVWSIQGVVTYQKTTGQSVFWRKSRISSMSSSYLSKLIPFWMHIDCTFNNRLAITGVLSIGIVSLWNWATLVAMNRDICGSERSFVASDLPGINSSRRPFGTIPKGQCVSTVILKVRSYLKCLARFYSRQAGYRLIIQPFVHMDHPGSYRKLDRPLYLQSRHLHIETVDL